MRNVTVCHVAPGRRAGARTLFPVFTASRAWTAASLAEAGRLDPASVAALVPEFAETPWPITPLQLATHRSGVRHAS